jgi:hypothetical protein
MLIPAVLRVWEEWTTRPRQTAPEAGRPEPSKAKVPTEKERGEAAPTKVSRY